MSLDIKTHVANFVLAAQSFDPAAVRERARQKDDVGGRAAVRDANHIADALTPHFLAFRELIEEAEQMGWPESDTLNRAREAHAALTGWTS